MKIIDLITALFSPTKPLPEGIHHSQSAPGDEVAFRLHLRLRKDGTGVLVVNAATVLHLNATAAEYAYHMIRGSSEEQAAKEIAARYRVSKNQAMQDFRDFVERIHTLVHTPDLDPVSYLDFERVEPHSQLLTAPLRLDCALTYSLPPGADASLAPQKRVTRELTTEEWNKILDQAWAVGIPHITFTGGEPTLRPDLPELIAHAETNGQVSGLLTDGLKLADEGYFDNLLKTGLDHLLFILQPDKDESWNALSITMPKDIFTTVHITIDIRSASHMEDILRRLAGLHVTAVSLSADPEFKDILAQARELAANLNMRLVWDLPVPYSALNPVALETAEEQPISGAGKAWLYVEPDGDVLPSQGMADQVLGNILTDPWEKIYK